MSNDLRQVGRAWTAIDGFSGTVSEAGNLILA
jgi:hypothetical protein